MRNIRLFSYILRSDLGLAPNPFWGILSLNVCKPRIRSSAEIGDWVIGTGAKGVKTRYGGKTNCYSGKLVYAMRVTRIITMEQYDEYCNLQLIKKIPNPLSKDWRISVGDNIYNYQVNIGVKPGLRKGIHTEINKKTDLSGRYTLLSTEFYYFGDKAVELPIGFKNMIKSEQGHKVITNPNQISEFESWLRKNYHSNRLYGEPQLKFLIEKQIKCGLQIKCVD